MLVSPVLQQCQPAARLGRSANIQEQEVGGELRVGGFYHDFACLLDGDGAGANNRSDSSKITFAERSALDCAQYTTRLEGSI